MTREQFMAPVSVEHPPCANTLALEFHDTAFQRYFAEIRYINRQLAAKRFLDFREAAERMEIETA